ncbi:heme-binding beta-barrel domain-containing protein [Ferrimonas marina]|nr:heme-binding beta-barrel domain-containing protein [Ferrimonas marina]
MASDTKVNGVDYGPLARLLGEWRGEQGQDRSPEPDGAEQNAFYETLIFRPAGQITNAESQRLVALRYHRRVNRQSDHQEFHEQHGYWLWDKEREALFECFVTPRGVAVVAEGKLPASAIEQERITFSVQTRAEGHGIAQTAFLQEHASTIGFTHQLTLSGNQLSYTQTTSLDIYQHRGFDHTDSNTLHREGQVMVD